MLLLLCRNRFELKSEDWTRINWGNLNFGSKHKMLGKGRKCLVSGQSLWGLTDKPRGEKESLADEDDLRLIINDSRRLCPLGSLEEL